MGYVSLPEGILLKCPSISVIFGASVWPRATRNSRWSFTKVCRGREVLRTLGPVGWGPFDEPPILMNRIWKNQSVWISVWFSKVMWSQRWNFWFMILPFIHFDHRNMYDMNWPFINSCHKKIMSKFCLDIFLPCSFRVDLMKHSGDTNNLWRQFLVGYSCGEFIHSVWMHAKKSWFNPGSSLLIVSP